MSADSFVIRAMTENDAHAIAGWRYDGIYAFYDAVADRQDLAELLHGDGALRRVCHRPHELVDELGALDLDPLAGACTIAVPVKVDERPDLNLQDLAKRYPMVIAVDRDAKVLRLYKHLQLEKRYKIAVGQASYETKAGRYKIVEKTVDPPWHAPNKAWAGELAGQTIPPGDPRNPLAARWLGIADGQGIHGTKDIESLGSAASHGCIRMSVKAVKQLYRQVKKGAPVFLQ